MTQKKAMNLQSGYCFFFFLKILIGSLLNVRMRSLQIFGANSISLKTVGITCVYYSPFKSILPERLNDYFNIFPQITNLYIARVRNG